MQPHDAVSAVKLWPKPCVAAHKRQRLGQPRGTSLAQADSQLATQAVAGGHDHGIRLQVVDTLGCTADYGGSMVEVDLFGQMVGYIVMAG